MLKHKRWLVLLVLIPVLFLLIKLGAAQVGAITNYVLNKSVVDMGGAPSQSINYKLVDAIGQPGGLGATASTNYRESSGFLTGETAAQEPVLSVSPTTLDFGTSETGKTFQISNTGGGTLNWTVIENPDKPWITSVSPSSGSDNATITVTIDRSQLIGSSDTGTLVVSSNGGDANISVQIQAPVAEVPILATVASTQTIGSEFWVDVEVGSSDNPVNDLKIVSFELNYTNTSVVDYLSFEVGPFLPGAQTSIIPDDPNGKLSASVYRVSGGDSGNGIILRLKFKILDSAVLGQTVCFDFGTIQANNSSGAEIELTPSEASCTEISSILVWPGDANNDGQVSIFDINSIVAIYWEKTGPPRPDASFEWIAQPCSPWDPEAATYADCNGDGTVNIFDINSVIINFGKTHGLLAGLSSSNNNQEIEQSEEPLMTQSSLTDPPISIEARDYDEVNQEFWIDVIIGSTSQPVSDLKVVSFELTYTNTSNIDYEIYQIGTLITDAQATVIADEANGKISASVYRTSGGNSGNGVVLSLKFKAGIGQNVDFEFAGVMANSSNGSTIPLTATGNSIVTNVSFSFEVIPENYSLFQNYPNPFNPETTIEYNLPQPAEVKLTIYDLHGKKVRELLFETKTAGFHSIKWDARNNSGQPLASGVYFYRIETKAQHTQQVSFIDVRKMILMK